MLAIVGAGAAAFALALERRDNSTDVRLEPTK
jgi:hypothetical protein